MVVGLWRCSCPIFAPTTDIIFILSPRPLAIGLVVVSSTRSQEVKQSLALVWITSSLRAAVLVSFIGSTTGRSFRQHLGSDIIARLLPIVQRVKSHVKPF
jgi:hypothetical protein